MFDVLYVSDEEGTHYLGPYREYTACGKAFDGENGDAFMRPASTREVTCPSCIQAILHYRRAKIKPDR